MLGPGVFVRAQAFQPKQAARGSLDTGRYGSFLCLDLDDLTIGSPSMLFSNWAMLSQIAFLGDLHEVPIGAQSPIVKSAAVSPDGSIFVTCSETTNVCERPIFDDVYRSVFKIWDVEETYEGSCNNAMMADVAGNAIPMSGIDAGDQIKSDFLFREKRPRANLCPDR